MELSSTKLGPFTLYTIETGRFRLDGGAMFGVVPKTLWSRQIEADDKNRIPMAMRCLLITSENTGKVYLVDDGCGTKFNEKYEKIYALDHSHSNLIDSLALNRRMSRLTPAITAGALPTTMNPASYGTPSPMPPITCRRSTGKPPTIPTHGRKPAFSKRIWNHWKALAG